MGQEKGTHAEEPSGRPSRKMYIDSGRVRLCKSAYASVYEGRAVKWAFSSGQTGGRAAHAGSTKYPVG